MILQRSLTLRLTCFFTIAAVAVLCSLSLLLNHEMYGYFLSEDIHSLRNKAYLIEDIVSKTDFDSEFAEIAGKMEKLEGVALRVNKPGNHIALYVSDNIHFPEKIIIEESPMIIDTNSFSQEISNNTYTPSRKRPTIRSLKNQVIEWHDEGQSYRGMQFKFKLNGSNKSSVIATVALNISHRSGFLEAFKGALIKFTIIAAFISGALQWFITSHGLRPLKTLSKKVKLVSGKDIKQQMPVDNLPVEISGLSETLNMMLERLDDSFKRLENFSSDIAHELRTPISNLMMQTQVVLSKPRDKNEYLMALGSNYEEFERLARMISDMLFLAKADNDQLLLSAEPILLEHEVMDLFDFYDALAEDRHVRLVVEGKAKIQGDKLMLRRVFNNLISNAMHHSDEHSDIKICISDDDENAIVTVSNKGQTIPAEMLPHLFDRFYRADKARTCCSFERVGLGLAITKSIIKAHGGEINVASSDKVTTFTFTLSKEV